MDPKNKNYLLNTLSYLEDAKYDDLATLIFCFMIIFSGIQFFILSF